MKKIIVFIVLCIIAGTSRSQIIYLEDFDHIDGPTSGGAGTYAFSPGYRLRNVDNRTPDASVSYVNEAWERREDFKFNVTDSCAFSTSWYSPVGAADDFMWTSLIGPLPPFAELSWNAVAYDALFRDGYEVRIMTVSNGIPGGGTGVIGNQVTNSTLLFSITEENASWTNRTVSLAAYAGQSVYIGFRNISIDKFLLLIDDIKVETNIPYDAQVLNVTDYEYSMIPRSQAGAIALGASIRNNGQQSLTNVNLVARIYNSTGALIHTQNGVPIPTLNAGMTSVFSLTSWSPPSPDDYMIRYFPASTEADVVPQNDTINKPLQITDSVYARDDGIVTMATGIGFNPGYLGQSFTIQTAVELGSITVAYNRGYTGRKYGLAVWSTTGTGTPNAIIAATDTLLYPDDALLADTIPIYGGKILLPPGEYVVTAIEFDSALSLCMTNSVFVPGKMWASWPGQPWANVETFGVMFRKPFYIRLNVNEAAVLPVKLIAFTGVHTTAGNKLEWQVTEQQDIIRYEVERSMNGRDFTMIGFVSANHQSSFTYRFTDPWRLTNSAFYRLRIIENNKSSYSRVIHIRPGANQDITLFPNPAVNTATLQGNDTRLLNTSMSLLNVAGRELKQITISQLPFSFDVSGLPPGVYLLRLYDNRVFKLVKQ